MQTIARKTKGLGLLVSVLVIVNGIAIWGQAGWAHSHLVPQMLPASLVSSEHGLLIGYGTALVLAAALELTGVYLAVMADEAQRNGQPSGGLRIGSYLCGLLSGALNFSHWTGLAAKLSLGFLSTISPFLWGVFSRVRHGETIAPSRRLWHPFKSIKLIRRMAWEGEANETEMIRVMKEEAASPEEISVEEEMERMENLLQEQRVEEEKRGAEMFLEISAEEAELLPLELENVKPISPKPISPAGPRAPRLTGDVEKAVEMLLLGEKRSEVARISGVSAATVGRLGKVLGILRENRSAAIDYRAEKVREEQVEMMRRAVAR